MLQTVAADLVPAVEGIGLSRSYGGVRALNNATFSALPGEVHALVGENGAGKSTLIKVLGGRVRPESGTVRVMGENMSFAGPHDAHRAGAWTVFQELTLLPAMTVAENLLFGRPVRNRFKLIDRAGTERAADALLNGLGITYIDPRALVEDISLAERQVVEIARAITQDAKILFLDEPTSSLVEREVEWLFRQIRRLRAAGTSIVFTSHRWHEIRNIADRITVFRAGREVGTYTELDEDHAVTLMTDRRVDALYPARSLLLAPTPTLEVKGLAGTGISGVSLTLHKGEILGVGGLAGHGHRELFFMLFGAARAAGGTVTLNGRPVRLRRPRAAIRAGIALVPEDRKSEGLLLSIGIRENLTLSVLRRVSRFGVIGRRREQALCRQMVDRLRIRSGGLGAPVGTLSGGNQQKVLLGRWLLTDCQILLLYDVTRGVDVATKHEIYDLMMRLAGQGKAILFYSSEAEELAHLAHRVLVLREGRVAAELSGAALTAERIVAASVRDHHAV
ncbi:MAG TPA: sugar ABC transporter ATP-binding protein [Acidocella sp.]|jgi:ribose transport system ATP-binding protein|uniref:sugar ABC transporter ATP-binding protein n=1 Tax=Acidocella sp. TaxID=50710 RepID=UPI002C7F60CD|nr:sugar ABC transporter ATP-binding protein [Acidocella sp.]HVE22537.1 sugar ABC transporter ATP-binding protein [Acidocella sp.]